MLDYSQSHIGIQEGGAGDSAKIAIFRKFILKLPDNLYRARYLNMHFLQQSFGVNTLLKTQEIKF